jgi:hypothetical protein
MNKEKNELGKDDNNSIIPESSSSNWTHIEEFFKSIGKLIRNATKEKEGTTSIFLLNNPSENSKEKEE